MDIIGGGFSRDHDLTVLGPLAYDDEVVLFLEGKYVVNSIARRDIISARVETRPSFKHPIMGFVVGLLFLAGAGLVFFGESMGIEWLELPAAASIAAVFVAIAGLYLVCASFSGGTSLWLIAETPAGQREFPLNGKVTENVEEFVESLGAP